MLAIASEATFYDNFTLAFYHIPNKKKKIIDEAIVLNIINVIDNFKTYIRSIINRLVNRYSLDPFTIHTKDRNVSAMDELPSWWRREQTPTD